MLSPRASRRPEQAVDAAAKSVAGSVTEVELGGQHGTAVWKTDIIDAKGIEHEALVNATDGKATAGRADRAGDADDRGDAALAKSPETGPGQAAATALDKAPGTATSAELDDDPGKTSAWHVDIVDGHGTEHEVTVDVQTGKVTTTHAAQDHAGIKGTDDDRQHD